MLNNEIKNNELMKQKINSNTPSATFKNPIKAFWIFKILGLIACLMIVIGILFGVLFLYFAQGEINNNYHSAMDFFIVAGVGGFVVIVIYGFAYPIINRKVNKWREQQRSTIANQGFNELKEQEIQKDNNSEAIDALRNKQNKTKEF